MRLKVTKAIIEQNIKLSNRSMNMAITYHSDVDNQNTRTQPVARLRIGLTTTMNPR